MQDPRFALVVNVFSQELFHHIPHKFSQNDFDEDPYGDNSFSFEIRFKFINRTSNWHKTLVECENVIITHQNEGINSIVSYIISHIFLL